MRLNKYIAASSELSRRGADNAIANGRITINGIIAIPGQDVSETDIVTLDGEIVAPISGTLTIMLNKPRGYVVSREGQGSYTVYDLLPPVYQRLNPVGRLDKESSGVLLLTNDGQLANELTHPSHQKAKIYEVTLDKPLEPLHRQMISDHGLQLEDGLSKLQLERLKEDNNIEWIITMHEGRNRQIRRTFASLGYSVISLNRTSFGSYRLNDLPLGSIREI